MNSRAKISRTRRVAIAFMALLLIAFAAQPAAACPTCKQALADGSNGGDVVGGYFWSIVFMMSMPFAILGAMSTYFYVQVRRARARRPAAAKGAPPQPAAKPKLAEA